MRLAKALAWTTVLLTVFAVSVNAALLEERVTDGTLDLQWVPGFNTPNTMYGKLLDPESPAYANPSGDHSVAVAQNASPDSGGIIATMVDPGPVSSDYVWEGWIFTGGGDTRRGLIVRATPENAFQSMYQFVIQQGLFRLSFRKLVNAAPTTLADWFASTLPAGGIPQNTWHKLKVIASGDQFRCFFDDFELTTAPIVDATIASGWVGCYNFRFDRGNVPVYFDDLALSCTSELPVDFQVTPRSLNLRSLGPWVKGVIEPAPPTAASDIDVASIRLNGTVAVDPNAPVEIGDEDGDGIADLGVRFLRGDVDLTVSEGDAVPVTVTGRVAGACFSGTDYVKVLRPKVLSPVAGEVLSGGSIAAVRWELSSGTFAPTVALLYSSDDGATWSVTAMDVPNTGQFDWTVPSVSTEQARIAVVQIESADETGYQVEGVLSVSEAFVISSPVGVGDVSLGLSLRGLTNPSRGLLKVSFSLASPGAARLALYDVSGRLLSAREIPGAGPGFQVVTLMESAPTGMYVVRLSQGGKSVSTRLTVIR